MSVARGWFGYAPARRVGTKRGKDNQGAGLTVMVLLVNIGAVIDKNARSCFVIWRIAGGVVQRSPPACRASEERLRDALASCCKAKPEDDDLI
jgi:hypothetical protein